MSKLRGGLIQMGLKASTDKSPEEIRKARRREHAILSRRACEAAYLQQCAAGARSIVTLRIRSAASQQRRQRIGPEAYNRRGDNDHRCPALRLPTAFLSRVRR
jgi:hypothetical protein